MKNSKDKTSSKRSVTRLRKTDSASRTTNVSRMRHSLGPTSKIMIKTDDRLFNNNKIDTNNRAKDDDNETLIHEDIKPEKLATKVIEVQQETLIADFSEFKENRKTVELTAIYDSKKEMFNRGYKIEELIGSGSYAHVFKCKDEKNKRLVAVKLIQYTKCSQHYKDIRLKHEIHVIRKMIVHPNIVHFYEAFNMIKTKTYAMVMEYINQGTFADELFKNGVMPENKARRLFRGITSGLCCLHHIGIGHRDLKMENLLLNCEMTPKIIDFSLSIIWDRKTLCDEFCGTVPYFPPEIFQKTNYNPLAYDVWSLGVCLYISVTNALPFKENESDEVKIKQRINREWSFRPKYESILSNNLKNLIRAMFEPDFNKRLTSDEVLNSKWFNLD